MGEANLHWNKRMCVSDFSRHLVNLSPKRIETLNFPPSRVGKGVRGLGFRWTFPHNVKSQNVCLTNLDVRERLKSLVIPSRCWVMKCLPHVVKLNLNSVSY